MLSGTRRPLLNVASTSRAPIFASGKRFAGNVVQSDNRQRQGVQIKKKKDDKPPRDKVPGWYVPIPASQIRFELQGQVDNLSDLAVMPGGAVPEELIGKALQFPPLRGQMLKSFGLPRNMLTEFRFLSRPAAVLRRIDWELSNRLDEVANNPGLAHRYCLAGPAGCGKSYSLFQAVVHCILSGWIVIYIPRAHKLVDSSTSYVYDLRTQTYVQPVYSNQLLQRLLQVNERALRSMRLSDRLNLDDQDSLPVGTALTDLIDLASRELHLAPRILSGILEELGKQTQYPVLLAVDELQSLYCKTEYKNQHFEHIKSYHLSIPRLLMEYASGRRSFTRGVFLGATTMSLTQFPLPVEFHKGINPDLVVDPYTKMRQSLLQYAQGLRSIPVPERLELNEAAAMFELWMKDGALHTRPTDDLFLSKYTEAQGNARDFVRNGILSTLLT